MVEIDSHFRRHDPILDANHCEQCNAALRHTLILMADMDLGPKDAVTLANQIRRLALGIESVPDRPIEDVVAPQFAEVDPEPWLAASRDIAAHYGPSQRTVEEARSKLPWSDPDADIDIPLPPR